MPPKTASGPPPAAAPWRRLWPLALLAGGLALAYATGLHRLLSFEALAEHRATLAGWVAARPLLTAAAYMLAYVVVVTFSLPGGAVMSLAGGFLFGTALGTALIVPAATAGACLLFLGARHALGRTLAERGGETLARISDALRRDGLWYLLSLRLLPVVPFWLANLAPALAGMPLRAFALATAIGIVPGSAVYAGIGAGLGAVLDRGERPDLGLILSPAILLPLVGLAALSLLGAWARRRRG